MKDVVSNFCVQLVQNISLCVKPYTCSESYLVSCYLHTAHMTKEDVQKISFKCYVPCNIAGVYLHFQNDKVAAFVLKIFVAYSITFLIHPASQLTLEETMILIIIIIVMIIMIIKCFTYKDSIDVKLVMENVNFIDKNRTVNILKKNIKKK